MSTISIRCKLLTGVAGLAVLMAGAPMAAQADEVLDNVLRRLEKLERENAKLRAKVDSQGSGKSAKSDDSHKAPPTNASAATPGVASPAAYASPPIASNDGSWYIQKKDGPGLTFQTPGGEIGVYGQFDVSIDATTKGLKGIPLRNPGNTDAPVGNVGWLPAVASNLSLIGIRGNQKIMDTDFRLVYQLETLIDVAVNSGIRESNSQQSNTVSGALTTRDSFIGVQEKQLGTLRIGKTESPYKKSTDVFNPFNGMIGDYRVVMGNTGGDNRVEFATRLEHSIWWESPDWNGLKFVALFSPGQNRSNSSDNIPSGSGDCAGGNNPASGGFFSCADGAFSDALSLSATYQKDGFLITTAYERHEKVNRQSDLGSYSLLNLNPDSGDVAAEDAFKVGVLYKFPTKTTIGGIWESMHRDVPARLQFQNERTRDGTWLFVSQELGEKDEVSFGWAHAFRTPGDPGQHNSPGGFPGGPPPKNEADMLTGAYKHNFSKSLTWYIDYAATINKPDAHFDLGAGGHGVTTDCHDASDAVGGVNSNPHCFTGSTLQGVSTGLKYKF